MPTLAQLPIPDHFQITRVGEVWRVPYQERARQAIVWVKQHRILPAAQDNTRICLLLVDVQNTFCIPGFELFVGGRSGMGAVEDNQRLCQFLYRNLGQITEIIATLDTHTASQIFHAIFWVDRDGAHPAPLTIISLEQVQAGLWQVNPAIADSLGAPDLTALQDYALHYVTSLSRAGKFPLTIWPYHSMLGSIGHALVSAVEEACFFHAIARQHQTRFELKGRHPLTENYSILRPEVMELPGGEAIAGKNLALIHHLLGFDAIYIAGQAKSHCVAWSMDDLLTEINQINPRLSEKVYILEDCTSPVVVPGIVDFTEQANAAFQRFAAAGVKIVRSTDSLVVSPVLS